MIKRWSAFILMLFVCIQLPTQVSASSGDGPLIGTQSQEFSVQTADLTPEMETLLKAVSKGTVFVLEITGPPKSQVLVDVTQRYYWFDTARKTAAIREKVRTDEDGRAYLIIELLFEIDNQRYTSLIRVIERRPGGGGFENSSRIILNQNTANTSSSSRVNVTLQEGIPQLLCIIGIGEKSSQRGTEIDDPSLPPRIRTEIEDATRSTSGVVALLAEWKPVRDE